MESDPLNARAQGVGRLDVHAFRRGSWEPGCRLSLDSLCVSVVFAAADAAD